MSRRSTVKQNTTIGNSSETCQVCGATPAGWHCGTITCEACKKFFLRKLNEGILGVSCVRLTNNCIITKKTRTNCQYCRFQRCIQVGMKSPDEEQKPQTADFSGIECKVCQDEASGFHFGAITCEGCKGFFRRTINERQKSSKNLVCESGGSCQINNRNRNSCRACRFERCLRAGMDLDKIKIGRQSNLFKKRLREVAKGQKHLESPSTISIIPIDFHSTDPISVNPNQINLDGLEPVYADLIKEILHADEESCKSTVYQIHSNRAIPLEFFANNFEKCKRFLESMKFFLEFDQEDRNVLLFNEIHPFRLIQVLAKSTLTELNYFECDKETMKAIAVYLPTFERINEDLNFLSAKIRELKLDRQEIALYKAYFAFATRNLKKKNLNNFQNQSNVARQFEIQWKLSGALQKFMFTRRNENESSQVLFQLMTIVHDINLELQRGLKKDLENLKSNGFIYESNFLSQFLIG